MSFRKLKAAVYSPSKGEAVELKNLPSVDRIQGFQLERYRTPQASQISVQYIGNDGIRYDLRFSFLDGMYLRNALNQMEKEAGFGAFDKPLA